MDAKRIPPYVPLSERSDSSRALQRDLYRDAMGRDPGEPVPLGLTMTRGTLTLTVNVTTGALPRGLKLRELCERPRRRRRPMVPPGRFVVGACEAAARAAGEARERIARSDRARLAVV